MLYDILANHCVFNIIVASKENRELTRKMMTSLTASDAAQRWMSHMISHDLDEYL